MYFTTRKSGLNLNSVEVVVFTCKSGIYMTWVMGDMGICVRVCECVCACAHVSKCFCVLPCFKFVTELLCVPSLFPMTTGSIRNFM